MTFSLLTFPLRHPSWTIMGADLISVFAPEEVQFASSLIDPSSFIERVIGSTLEKVPFFSTKVNPETLKSCASFAQQKGDIDPQVLNTQFMKYAPVAYPYLHFKKTLRDLYRFINPQGFTLEKAEAIGKSVRKSVIKHKVTTDEKTLDSIAQFTSKTIQTFQPEVKKTKKDPSEEITYGKVGAHIAAPLMVSAVNWFLLRHSFLSVLSLQTENIPLFSALIVGLGYWKWSTQPTKVEINMKSSKDEISNSSSENEQASKSGETFINSVTHFIVGSFSSYLTYYATSKIIQTNWSDHFSSLLPDLFSIPDFGVAETIGYYTGFSGLDLVGTALGFGSALAIVLMQGEFAPLRNQYSEKMSNFVFGYDNSKKTQSSLLLKSNVDIFKDWYSKSNPDNVRRGVIIGAMGGIMTYAGCSLLPLPSVWDLMLYAVWSQVLLPKKIASLNQRKGYQPDTTKIQEIIIKKITDSCQNKKTELDNFKKDLPGLINLTPFTNIKGTNDSNLVIDMVKKGWSLFSTSPESIEEKPQKKKVNTPITIVSDEKNQVTSFTPATTLPTDPTKPPASFLPSYKTLEELNMLITKLETSVKLNKEKQNDLYYFLAAQYYFCGCEKTQHTEYTSDNEDHYNFTKLLINQIDRTVNYFKKRNVADEVIKNYLTSMKQSLPKQDQHKTVKSQNIKILDVVAVNKAIDKLMPKENDSSEDNDL